MGKFNSAGFGALEFIIVLTVVFSMYIITFVGINPAKQLSEVYNAKRRIDVKALNDALLYYGVDHDGDMPHGIGTVPEYISKNGVDLCQLLVGQYLPGLPTDPVKGFKQVKDCALDYDTHYTIFKEAFDGRITISAPNAELGESIELTQ